MVVAKKVQAKDGSAKEKASSNYISAPMSGNNSNGDSIPAPVVLFTVKKSVVFDKTVLLDSESILFPSFYFHEWNVFQLKAAYDYSQKKEFNLHFISHSAFITFSAKQNKKTTISI